MTRKQTDTTNAARNPTPPQNSECGRELERYFLPQPIIESSNHCEVVNVVWTCCWI